MNLAFWLFCRHGILPSQAAAMSRNEKALVAAMIELQAEEERRHEGG